MRAEAARVLLASVLVALAACTLERPATVAPATFDLGPPASYAKANRLIDGTVLVPPVRAPAWLDESEIVYRLLYEDTSRPQTYAMSQWAAAPASLLTDRLRSRLAAASGGVVSPGYSASSDYTLRVELDDFSQRFDSPQASRVTLKARATLLDSKQREVLAQRTFEIDRSAEPNAPGAVAALSEAVDGFLEQLVEWTAHNARKAAK